VALDAAPPPHPQALDTPPRPAWLLREPLALDEDDGVPLQEPASPTGPGPAGAPRPSRRARRLLLIGKAERIETGWFDGHLVRRDYHVALGRDGVLRWVYVERGTSDSDTPRWFLHGLFA
jgi:protein ImuB